MSSPAGGNAGLEPRTRGPEVPRGAAKPDVSGRGTAADRPRLLEEDVMLTVVALLVGLVVGGSPLGHHGCVRRVAPPSRRSDGRAPRLARGCASARRRRSGARRRSRRARGGQAARRDRERGARPSRRGREGRGADRATRGGGRAEAGRGGRGASRASTTARCTSSSSRTRRRRAGSALGELERVSGMTQGRGKAADARALAGPRPARARPPVRQMEEEARSEARRRARGAGRGSRSSASQRATPRRRP